MNDLEKIKQLRQSTGAGFNDCSVALKESNGNLDKAVEVLRVKGVAKASKKMSREAREGVIALSGNEKKISILEVNCETDFVAKNNDFISFVKELSEINNSVDSNLDKLIKKKMKNNKTVDENLLSMIAKIGEKITLGRCKTLKNENTKNFFYLHSVVKDNLSKLAVIVSLKTTEKFKKLDLFGKQLTMHIAASNPIAITSSEIKKEIMDKEQKIISEELKNSGKPKDIANKISLGKINKFKEENSLMTQNWVMDPKKKVKDIIEEFKIKYLQIVEFYRLKIGE
jgi:elongation factor Ts